jgi:HSP20 family protein
MSKDLIRLMHALFLPGVEACQDAPWRPHTDVYRTAGGWLVKFELAGVRAEDIDLQAIGGRLLLRGVRRDCVQEAAQKIGLSSPVHYGMEIEYSRFERGVELPCDLKKADISTEYRDGMLLVCIDQRGGAS